MTNDKREKARGNLTAYGYTPWQKLRELRRQRDRYLDLVYISAKEIAMELIADARPDAVTQKDINFLNALEKELGNEV